MLSTLLPTPQESVSSAIHTSPSLSDYLAARNQETCDLDETIRNCVEDRKHQLLFDPRVLIRANAYDDIEPGVDSRSIMVLVSKRNARRELICDPSHFLNIMFYKNLDVSLEKFLRDLFNQGNRCNACDELPQAHFYNYVHQKIQVRIQVKRLPVGERLPGEANGDIWMWSRCCEKDVTKKVMMSVATRSLSFGKFLDLSFSQHTLLDRWSSCGHSFLHFYGLGYMVAMFSYSQVATYTAILPPPKLEVSISLRASWLDKEFRSVFIKGISMFEEIANFLKQRKSNITSCPSLSNIQEILKKERSRFEENIKNDYEEGKTLGGRFQKLLRLNRKWWEFFLQAIVWNYRLHSLVLHDHIQYSSSDKKLPTSVEENDQWFWISFEDLRSKSIVDIEKEYTLTSKIVGNFSQENLPIVNNIIIQEGSRLQISLGDEYCVVSVYEDELSSLIAYTLAQISNDEKIMPLTRCTNGSLERSFDKDQAPNQNIGSEGSKFESLTTEILVTFGLADSHARPKYSVVCLYAKDFCDFRKHCCFSELEYIDSLSRCEKWNYAKNGEEKLRLVKTVCDRFIVKEIERIEYESFVKFGPEYFKYMKDTYELGNQTCLAKVFGIYQVIIRQPNGQREIQHNLMVMENLNFGRNISHKYNLKGPLLTRFTTSTDDGVEEIMLGPNFFKDMNNSPVYFSKDSKRNLQSAVMNDIKFLDSINVMDYSLLVGVDLERRELVCGIIDYFKQYTWDMSYPCRIL